MQPKESLIENDEILLGGFKKINRFNFKALHVSAFYWSGDG